VARCHRSPRYTTNANIVGQNQEDGAQAQPSDAKKIVWRATPQTKEAPMAVLPHPCPDLPPPNNRNPVHLCPDPSDVGKQETETMARDKTKAAVVADSAVAVMGGGGDGRWR